MEQALEELAQPMYNKKQCAEDKEFVLKKLGFSEEEFEDYIKQVRREHNEFKTEGSLYQHYPILKPLKPLGDFVKKMLH